MGQVWGMGSQCLMGTELPSGKVRSWRRMVGTALTTSELYTYSG